MRVLPIPCLSDNYAYLVVCDATKTCAIVDPSTLADTERAIVAIMNEGLALTEIWATHHHGDHVGGVADVMKRFDVRTVVGFANEERIPEITTRLADGETRALGTIAVRGMHVPGHTSGALAYFCEAPGALPCVFSGDTLFSAGCGRMFEGTAPQMHASLMRLAALPSETRVYSGHEYTASNLAFAQHLEPRNTDVARALALALDKRTNGHATVPSKMVDERATNPFLRAGEPTMRPALGLPATATDVEVFAAARAMKDTFRAR